MHIHDTAPVTAAGTIAIAARPEHVWDLLTDISRWPEWNADIDSASLPGPVARGETFRWKAGMAKLVSTIQTVDRPVEIGWTGRTLGMDAVHVWRLERDGDSTIAHTEESWDGLPARLLPRTMRRSLQGTLDSWLVTLKTTAEAREGPRR